MTAECRLYLITPPRLDDLAAYGRNLAAALIHDRAPGPQGHHHPPAAVVQQVAVEGGLDLIDDDQVGAPQQLL